MPMLQIEAEHSFDSRKVLVKAWPVRERLEMSSSYNLSAAKKQRNPASSPFPLHALDEWHDQYARCYTSLEDNSFGEFPCLTIWEAFQSQVETLRKQDASAKRPDHLSGGSQ